MSGSTLAAWAVVALLGVMTPGIDTILVLRHTLLAGRRAGLATVAGIALGCVVWATASLIGLTALLAASEAAYTLVRWAGAAYLVWLGAKAIWRTLPRNRPAGGDEADDADAAAPMGPVTALRAGAVTNLLNPKVGVFYISLLPQFLPTGPGSAGWGAALVAVHIAITLAWYPAVIWAAARARGLLLRRRVRAWLDRVTAGALIGIGINLAAQSR